MSTYANLNLLKSIDEKVVFNFKLKASGTRKKLITNLLLKNQLSLMQTEQQFDESMQIWGDSILKVNALNLTFGICLLVLVAR